MKRLTHIPNFNPFVPQPLSPPPTFVFVHLPAWRAETAQTTLDAIAETVGLLIEKLRSSR